MVPGDSSPGPLFNDCRFVSGGVMSDGVEKATEYPRVGLLLSLRADLIPDWGVRSMEEGRLCCCCGGDVVPPAQLNCPMDMDLVGELSCPP
jgi:hypothetical protein